MVDSEALTSIIEQIQDLVLPISFKALVSVSPPARKFIHRLLSEKRIPAEVVDLMTAKATQVCQELWRNPKRYEYMLTTTQNMLEDITNLDKEPEQEIYTEERPTLDEQREQQYIDIDVLPPAQVQVSSGHETIKDGD